MEKSTVYYRCPIGWIKIQKEDAHLAALDFLAKKPSQGEILKKNTVLYRELDGYFHKKEKKFTARVSAQGTPFQRRVWERLKTIPFGKTVSYGEVAAGIGRKKSVRAVANAIGRNKFPVMIPCHRVIGSDGSLTGYAYGLRRKAWLIKHENG